MTSVSPLCLSSDRLLVNEVLKYQMYNNGGCTLIGVVTSQGRTGAKFSTGHESPIGALIPSVVGHNGLEGPFKFSIY